ncbi:hypothetical protein [Sporosarcina cyprini]|uniref:hypothetical protein n=1 Tax=Sporosarcina cyprini TaxID=2910523 RepID=UPI001EDD6110|nr:hypothetical protein [Sporosarcina cyprini]MCG3087052.1 hypothetical protein [Sporosarcina cyprini]
MYGILQSEIAEEGAGTYGSEGEACRIKTFYALNFLNIWNDDPHKIGREDALQGPSRFELVYILLFISYQIAQQAGETPKAIGKAASSSVLFGDPLSLKSYL